MERFLASLPHAGCPGRTYQGFSKAMLSRGPTLLGRMCEQLRVRIERLSGTSRVRRGFVAFAVDGTRVDCPRTVANAALGVARRLGVATRPQLLVTCLWHMGLGVLWDWRIGTIFESERTHLRGMLGRLPANALLVADCGFTGFDLLSAVQDSGRVFLVRVGAGIHLLKGLGMVRENRDTVYLWPGQRQRRGEAPLMLRLIRVGKVFLVTNVLDPTLLSREAAGALYRRRWAVEVGFRTLKQTLGRRKMRCAAPRQAIMELHGTLAALTLLGLMAARGLIARGLDPLDQSPAAALRTLRGWLANAARCPRRLMRELGRCVKDKYTRTRPKHARDWPHKKNPPPVRPPRIHQASTVLRDLAQRMESR